MIVIIRPSTSSKISAFTLSQHSLFAHYQNQQCNVKVYTRHRAGGEATPKMLERAFSVVRLSPISTSTTAWEMPSQTVLFLSRYPLRYGSQDVLTKSPTLAR